MSRRVTNRKDRSVARFGKELVFATALAVVLLFIPGPATGDEVHSHGVAPAHHPGLHFSHPLISESPSPDTKVRLDYFFQHVDSNDEKADQSTLRLEAEYAFHRTFSVSIQGPMPSLTRRTNQTRLTSVKLSWRLSLLTLLLKNTTYFLATASALACPRGMTQKGSVATTSLKSLPS